jgi:hypothetical protein
MLKYFADLEQDVTRLGMKTVVYASLVLIIATIVAALLKDKVGRLRLPLFVLMALALVGSTITLFASTVYLNMKSESGGPVHWHSDVEFWACGTELDLRDPNGILSNKVGTATFHEHNDKRMHLEGVVVHKSEDASLAKFMRVTGGFITSDAIGIPLNNNTGEWYATGDQLDGDTQSLNNAADLAAHVKQSDLGPVLELVNGQRCANQPAELQTFVYHYDKSSRAYSQEKLSDGSKYVMRDESVVPPGDCIIVEFDAPKASTDKLCRQYGVRDMQRCVKFGVHEYSPDLCNITETSGGAE